MYINCVYAHKHRTLFFPTPPPPHPLPLPATNLEFE